MPYQIHSPTFENVPQIVRNPPRAGYQSMLLKAAKLGWREEFDEWCNEQITIVDELLARDIYEA